MKKSGGLPMLPLEKPPPGDQGEAEQCRSEKVRSASPWSAGGAADGGGGGRGPVDQADAEQMSRSRSRSNGADPQPIAEDPVQQKGKSSCCFKATEEPPPIGSLKGRAWAGPEQLIADQL